MSDATIPNEVNVKKARRLSSRSFKMRCNIITEIIKTEESYVQDLRSIKKLFIEPIKSHDSDLVKSIFMNIEVICNLNEQVLKELQQLCPNIEDIDGDVNVGTAFSQLAAFFNIYSQYCVDYKKSIDLCEEIRQKNPTVSMILLTAEQNPICRGLQLKDFLIKPVQRLCKYPLLFRELVKVTPENHPDYSGVMSTFQKVEEVSSNVNKIRADRENYEKLTEFNANVAGFQDYDHFVTGRVAIRDEWLQMEEQTDFRLYKIPSHFRVKGTCHLHLWSDFLVVTRKSDRIFKTIKANEFICVFIPLRHLTLTEVGDEKKKEFKFLLEGNEPQHNRTRKLLVNCPSLGIKTQWSADIKSAVDKVSKALHEMGVASSFSDSVQSTSLRTTSSELTRSTYTSQDVSETRIDEDDDEDNDESGSEPKISIEELLMMTSINMGPIKTTDPKPPRPQVAPPVPEEDDDIVDCVLSILSDLSDLDLDEESENNPTQPSLPLNESQIETEDKPEKTAVRQKTFSRRLSQKLNSALILTNPKNTPDAKKDWDKLTITNPIRGSAEKENVQNYLYKKAKDNEKSEKTIAEKLEKKNSYDPRRKLDSRMASLPSLVKFKPKMSSNSSSPEIGPIPSVIDSKSPSLIRTSSRKPSLPDFNSVFMNVGVSEAAGYAIWQKSSSVSPDGHIFITSTHICFVSSGVRKIYKFDIDGNNLRTYLINQDKKRLKLTVVDDTVYSFKKVDDVVLAQLSTWVTKFDQAHPQPLSATSPPPVTKKKKESHTPKSSSKGRGLTRLQRKVTPVSSPKGLDSPVEKSRQRSSNILHISRKKVVKENVSTLDVVLTESNSLSFSTEPEPEVEAEPETNSYSSSSETDEENHFDSLREFPPIPSPPVLYTPIIKTVHDEVENFLAELEANTSSLYK